jgi:predicted RNase H-like nuclease (RuvC/YqgF family)
MALLGSVQEKYLGELEKQKYEQYKIAKQKIRDATGVSELNDLLQKFATQGDTFENLKDIKAQNEKKLMNLTEKRQQVKDDLEKMKLEGLEAMTRKQVDDMERNLAQAEQKYEKAKESYDKVKKMLLDL